ncbi:1238_t:CDS:2, partial [Scutellospora calospora]
MRPKLLITLILVFTTIIYVTTSSPLQERGSNIEREPQLNKRSLILPCSVFPFYGTYAALGGISYTCGYAVSAYDNCGSIGSWAFYGAYYDLSYKTYRISYYCPSICNTADGVWTTYDNTTDFQITYRKKFRSMFWYGQGEENHSKFGLPHSEKTMILVVYSYEYRGFLSLFLSSEERPKGAERLELPEAASESSVPSVLGGQIPAIGAFAVLRSLTLLNYERHLKV